MPFNKPVITYVALILLLIRAAAAVGQGIPTITTGPTAGTIVACAGGASTSPSIQQFAVSASSLIGDITATAPANFEISLSATSGFASSIAISQTGGAVNNTIVYVRSSASASGVISGNVALSSPGALSHNVSVNGTINALPLVNPVANQTVFTGNNTTPVNFTGTGGAYLWINSTPTIGLPASGKGNISSFKAINAGTKPVMADIMVTPISPVFAYVANTGAGTVSIINASTHTAVGTVAVGSQPISVATSPDGTRVYVANNNGKSISVISTFNNTVIATIPIGSIPNGIVVSPDGSKLYVTNTFASLISVINTSNNTVSTTIPVGTNPYGIAASPDGNTVYVTNYGSNDVSVINTSTNAVATIPVGIYPTGITVSPDGSRVYVANQNSNTITVINTADNSIIADIAVGTAPTGVAISLDGGALYVSNSNSNSVSITNTANNTVAATVAVGLLPYGISVSPDGSEVYVANQTSNNVSVINTATNTVSATINVGSKPYSFGTFISRGAGCTGTPVTFSITVNPTAISAPDISYRTPQVYKKGISITPLTPVNKGGAVPATIYGQVIPFAGNGAKGATNGTGSSVSFNDLSGLTTDALGNVYVADQGNFLIRKITPAGMVSTFAGTGVQGTADGPVSSASFTGTSGVTFDASGNMYLTDRYAVVREITPAGIVSTYAGDGTQGSTNGSRAAANFNNPEGIVADASGNLYLCDKANNVIRKITPAGVVSTFAGNGQKASIDGTGTNASFDTPYGITIDGKGNLYVTDGALVRRITPAGMVTTIAGNGLLTTFRSTFGITIDDLDNVYIVDGLDQKVYKIDGAGNLTLLAAGVGSFPIGTAYDGNGNLYVSDPATNSVIRVLTTGYRIDRALPPGLIFDSATGTISGTPIAPFPSTDYTITAYNLGGTSSARINITVLDNLVTGLPPNISYPTPQVYTVNNTIVPLVPANSGGAVPATTFAQTDILSGSINPGNNNGNSLTSNFRLPQGVIEDGKGNVYVADFGNNLIRKIDAAGNTSTFAGNGNAGAFNGTGTNATFAKPSSVVLDAAGNLYVADYDNNMIRKITPGGVVTTFAGTTVQGAANGIGASASFHGPSGLAIDAAGNLYVADKENNLIRKITPGGAVTTLAGTGAAGANNGAGTIATFNAPQNLAVDAAGNIYVTDSGNNLIRKITPLGEVSTFTGTGSAGSANGPVGQASFNGPSGIVIDGAGNIFVSDFVGNLIRMIVPSGIVSTLAGTGNKGSINGTGTAVSFNGPSGLAIDANGKLYVADFFSNEIRTVLTTGYYIDKALPPGMTFDRATGIISGTPNTVWPATDYTITAYNLYGNSTTVVNIKVVAEQSVLFGPLPPKTVCDNDFAPGATSGTKITYTSSNTAVATIISGMIHITGAGTSVITATDGSSSIDQTLNVSAALTPSITISKSSIDDCPGNGTYMAAIVDGGTAPSFQWQVNGRNVATNSDRAIFTNLSNQDQITCILTSNELCVTSPKATSNPILVILATPISTAVRITSSVTGPVCAGTPITFTAVAATPSPLIIYQWKVNGNDAGTNNMTYTADNFAAGDVVTCVLGSRDQCFVNPNIPSNSITIVFSPANSCIITIPNTFTPNGDGTNDLWNITALQNYPNCTVKVYNRYGEKVFDSIGYPKAWDGNFNGGRLPEGTYYYIIDAKNGKAPLAGYITLIR